jgi:hypothetical protein
MICQKCGLENESGGRFCKQCGAPLGEALPAQYAYSQPPFAPPQPSYTQPPFAEAPKKKGKAGLIIGICAGVLVIAGAVLAVLLLNPFGPSANGYWVAEEEGMVLSLDKSGELTLYSLAGAEDADYQFNKGEGSFKAGGVKYEFAVEKDTLKLTNKDTDDTVRFSREKEKPDIEEIVMGPLYGLWSSETAGAVLELKDNGDVISYTTFGDYTGDFEFDIDKGEGSMSVNSFDYTFVVAGDVMTLDEELVYEKASDGLDIDAFIASYSNPLTTGTWYEASGIFGSIDFFNDGTFTVLSSSGTYNGTYTFDASSGSGQLNYETGGVSYITFTDGWLDIDGYTFTQNYVEPPEDYSAVEGTWYESAGEGSITFYSDGTFSFYYNDTYYWGNFTFNTASDTGTVTLDTGETLNFELYGDSLYVEDIAFTREYADTSVGTIEGTWYDTDGVNGTLDFYQDGTVYMYSYGNYLSGTFTYDYDLGYGTMWLDNNGATETYELYLYDNNSLVIADEAWTTFIYYTKDYVYQSY